MPQDASFLIPSVLLLEYKATRQGYGARELQKVSAEVSGGRKLTQVQKWSCPHLPPGEYLKFWFTVQTKDSPPQHRSRLVFEAVLTLSCFKHSLACGCLCSLGGSSIPANAFDIESHVSCCLPVEECAFYVHSSPGFGGTPGFHLKARRMWPGLQAAFPVASLGFPGGIFS